MDWVDMSVLNINDQSTTFFKDEPTEELLLQIPTSSVDKMDLEGGKPEGEHELKPRRSSRKRAPRRLDSTENKQKFKKFDFTSEKDIERYYLDKKIKLANLSLETIFEEPENGNVMTSRRFKRSMKFESNLDIINVNKMKAKKRSAKAKKLGETVKKLKQKLPMDLLLEKLSCLDDVESTDQKMN
nr:unnamed protein product [Callosobruchus chinensis]